MEVNISNRTQNSVTFSCSSMLQITTALVIFLYKNEYIPGTHISSRILQDPLDSVTFVSSYYTTVPIRVALTSPITFDSLEADSNYLLRIAEFAPGSPYGFPDESHHGEESYDVFFSTEDEEFFDDDPILYDNPELLVTGVTSNSVSLSWNEFFAPPLARTDVAINSQAAIARKVDGTCVSWGYNYWDLLQIPAGLANIVEIAAGYNHFLARKSDNTVVGWGNDIPSHRMDSFSELSGIVSIGAGYNCSLFVHSDGTITKKGDMFPTPPVGLSNVARVDAGSAHGLALLTNGTLVAWGGNENGQTTLPASISNNVVAMSAGSSHSLALLAGGVVVAWGNNARGQCNVPAGLTAISISAGTQHSMALLANGTVVAWGNNMNGECNVPAGLSGVIKIAAGNANSLALKSDGTVVAWGESNYLLDVPPYYQIYRNGTSIQKLPWNSHETTVTGLSASTDYTFKVEGRWSATNLLAEASVTTKTLLVAPSSLTFLECTYDTYKLQWGGVSNATGYEIFRDGVSVGATDSTTRTFVFSGSTANSYQHQVKALGASVENDSVLSGVATIGRYSTPTNLVASNIGSTSFTLTWDGVPEVEALGWLGYYEVFKNDAHLVNVNVMSARTVEISGLLPGETASYAIRAGAAAVISINNTLFSHLSAPVTVKTTLGKLATPTNLVANDIEGQIFKLTWNPVVNATYYTIKYASSASGPFSDYSVNGSTPVAVDTNTLLITNLLVGTPRYYVVMAHAENYTSSNLSVALSVTGKSRLGAPTLLLDDVEGVTDSSIPLSWQNIPNEPSGTTYDVYQNGTFVKNVNETPVSGRTSTVITGLTPFTSYVYTVKAKHPDFLDSEASVQRTTRTRLSTPTGFSVVSVEPHTITFSCDPVPGAVGYYVENSYLYAFSTSSNLITFPWVAANQAFSFTIRAASNGEIGGSLSIGHDWSLKSAPIAATTLLEQPRLEQKFLTNTSVLLGIVDGIYYKNVNNPTSYEIYKDGALHSTFLPSEQLLVDDMVPNSNVSFTVKAKSGENESVVSPGLVVNFPVLLPAPQGLNKLYGMIVSDTEYGFAYTWLSPYGEIINPSSAAFLEYQVSFKRSGESEWAYAGWGLGFSANTVTSNIIFANYNQVVTVRVQARSGGVSGYIYSEYAEKDFLYPLKNIDYSYDLNTSEDGTSATVVIPSVAGATGYELLVLENLPVPENLGRYFSLANENADTWGALTFNGVPVEASRQISFSGNTITVNNLLRGQPTHLLVRAVNNLNGNYSSQIYIGYIVPAMESPTLQIDKVTSDSIQLFWENIEASTPYLAWYKKYGVMSRHNINVDGVLLFSSPENSIMDNILLLEGLDAKTDYNLTLLTYGIGTSSTGDGYNSRRWFTFSTSIPTTFSTLFFPPYDLFVADIVSDGFYVGWLPDTLPENHFFRLDITDSLGTRDRVGGYLSDNFISITSGSIAEGAQGVDIYPDTSYEIKVRIVELDTFGVPVRSSDYSDPLFLHTLLVTPKPYLYSSSIDELDPNISNIILAWDSVPGADYYRVYFNGIQMESTSANWSFFVGMLRTETYRFNVIAVREASEPQNVSQMSEDFYVKLDELLATPTNLVATDIAGTSFTLSWDAVVGATSYSIYRNGKFGVAYAEASTNTQIVTGLTPGTSYTFAVKALNATMFSEMSELLAVDMAAGLDAPANLVASNLAATSVTLSWDVVVGATSYEVYRNNKLVGTVTGATIDMLDLKSHTGYQLSVKAFSDNNESVRSEPLFIRTRLLTPQNLVANEISGSQFTLSWGAVEFAKVYLVFCDGVVYGGTNRDYLVIENLSPETTYVVQVKAFADDNSSELSDGLSVTTIVELTQPINLVASNVSGTGFTLSWDEVIGASEYEIYEDGDLLATVDVLSIDLTNLSQGVVYSMQVRAIDGDNFSIMSEILEVLTQSLVEPILGLIATNIRGTAFTLSWDVSANATSYEVYQDEILIATIPGNALEVMGLVPATAYNMQVKALGDNNNTSELSDILSVYTADYLATPVLTASSILGKSLILSWQNINFATSYEVYKDDALFATIMENTSRIEMLNPATKYTFSVKALGESNYSKMSEVLDITTHSRPSLMVSQLEIDREQQFNDLVVGLRAIDGVISLSAYNIFLTEGGYYWRVRYNGEELTNSRYFEVVEADGEYIVKVTNNGETLENTSRVTELQWDSPTLKGNTSYSWNVESKSVVSGADFTFTTGEQIFVDSPTNVTMSYDEETGAVTLTWEAVTEAVGYKVMYKAGDWNGSYGVGLTRDPEGTVPADSPIEVAADITSLTLYGLVADTSYWFFVQTVGGSNESGIVPVDGNLTIAGGAGGVGMAAPRKLYYAYNQATKEIVISWEPITE